MQRRRVIRLIKKHFSPASIKASILSTGEFTDTIEKRNRTIVVHIERNHEVAVLLDVTLSFSAHSENDIDCTLFASELGFDWVGSPVAPVAPEAPEAPPATPRFPQG